MTLRWFWFAAESPRSVWDSGFGVTARGPEDARWLLRDVLDRRPEVTIAALIEDVTLEQLAPQCRPRDDHALARGIWYPPSLASPFILRLTPLIERSAQSDLIAAAAEAIAADSRATLWAARYKRTSDPGWRSPAEKPTDRGFFQFLENSFAADDACRTAVERYEADGDEEALLGALERATALLSWRPPVFAADGSGGSTDRPELQGPQPD